jgi:protein gp37
VNLVEIMNRSAILNRTKIETCDYTWNPVTGCTHGCQYCYARRIAKRFGDSEFKPTFHPDRLMEPERLKKPSKIMVCSMGDLFCSGIDDLIILDVLNTVKECPRHTFQFFTKNPDRYGDFRYTDNCILGSSCEDQSSYDLRWPKLLNVRNDFMVFMSIEPLLGEIRLTRSSSLLDWIILGAQTGPGARKLKREWIESIVWQAKDRHIPIFCKSNLGIEGLPKEWPEGAES